MKKIKKLIKRIGAVLCALVVAVSSLGVSVPYYAMTDENWYNTYINNMNKVKYNKPTYECVYPLQHLEKYDYFISFCDGSNKVYVLFSNEPVLLKHVASSRNQLFFEFSNSSYSDFYMYSTTDGLNWKSDKWSQATFSCLTYENSRWSYYYSYVDSNYDVYFGYNGGFAINRTLSDNGGALDSYNASLGYLQNVKHNVVFDDVPLGENVAETFTERWYYDSLSTTGVDLTSGDYVIRYYQEKWIVVGYGEDDVIEKSDRYVLGDYIVQNGYIEAYSESIESTLAGQGYEEPSVFDLLWNKFVTTHYYFQIVNAKTNEVGGLLHVYLTDDNGKFGVEHIGETLDNEGNFDEGGYKDFIDEDKVTTDDVEQGFDDLENGSNVDFGTVDGVDEFGVILESFASQVSNVSSGVHALLSSMPSWVLGLLGVSFVLLVVGIIFKIV